MKWSRSIGNYARALDLYLALENAFAYYGEGLYDNRLLTKSQKKEVMSRLMQSATTIKNYLYSDAVQFSGVQIYETEPGNRPMKMFLAMGYAALGMQELDYKYYFLPGIYVYLNSKDQSNKMLRDAFRSGYLQENQNSIKYWSYQTANGQDFWAEGPYYFELTMNVVIPFWHAIRANNMLNYNGYNVPDPFHNWWFLNPLSWLADLTTWNGYLPPLDDGNKWPITYANLLRWSDTYGYSYVGRKFAWIGDKLESTGESLDKHTLLVQLAMPRVNPGNGIWPKHKVGNDKWYIPGNNAEQQLILRHQDYLGAKHYVLLNGESGDAIVRGEGHEQPDQLQLLYYVDGKSFLMDRGYDSAGPTSNSTWNFYKAHNIMSYLNAYFDGGIEAPHIDVRGRKVSDHQEVSELYIKNLSDRVSLLHGFVLLEENTLAIIGEYERNVLFIKGDESYVIDLNSLITQVYAPDIYNAKINNWGGGIWEGLFYHGNSNSFYQLSEWNYWDINESNKNLYMFLRPIEYGGSTIGPLSVSTRELNGEQNQRDIKRAALVYEDKIPNPIPIQYNNYNTYKRYFNTVAIFKADNVTPSNPVPIFSYQSDDKTPYQAWYWQPNSNTLDIIIKRSKVNQTIYDQEISFNLENFSLTDLRLPGSKDYGFLRFHKINGEWVADDSYKVNLKYGPPPPPQPSVTISGSSSLESGELGIWYAHAKYFDGTPTYKWYRIEIPNGAGIYTGVTSSSYSTAFSNEGSTSRRAGVKVIVTASGETVSATYNITTWPVGCDPLIGPNGITTNIIKPKPCPPSPDKRKTQSLKIIPDVFELSPNYPNPFSNLTTIRYGVPEQANVTLSVYNILGQKVTTLVDKSKPAGYYTIHFNAENLASGIYIIRITAKGQSGEEFVKLQKMMLIK